jgi:hypothetical protein
MFVIFPGPLLKTFCYQLAELLPHIESIMSLIFTFFDLYAVCILAVHMQEQQMTGD